MWQRPVSILSLWFGWWRGLIVAPQEGSPATSQSAIGKKKLAALRADHTDCPGAEYPTDRTVPVTSQNAIGEKELEA